MRDGIPVRIATTMPRTSAELQRYSAEYNLMQDIFGDFMEHTRSVVSPSIHHRWISRLIVFQMKEVLPQEYDKLNLYVDKLPADSVTPAYPFGGFVLNINVSTSVHRDWKDLHLCMVVVIASEDCEGGDLCFEELGLAVELRNGDMAIFASSKLSHFNTFYRGERCSMVFHTDAAGEGWLYNCNGWDGTWFMNAKEDVESADLNLRKF